MNLRKLQKAHATFGRRMAGRKYQDVSRAALAYERNGVLSQPATNTVMNEHENIDRKAKTCYALEHRKM